VSDRDTDRALREQEEYIRLLQGQIAEQEKRSAEHLRGLVLQLEAKMGAKFRALREERGWSQSEMAEQLGRWGFDLHQTAIAKIEAGKRPIRVAEMYAFAHAFRLPPGAIFYLALPVEGERVDDPLAALGEDLGRLEATMADSRDRMVEHIGSTIDMLGDMQLRRNHLVDTMQRLAAERTHGE
jgi:transcriptional regulator with XRE-family HTH domain